MKLFFHIGLLLFTGLFFSCKKEKENPPAPAPVPVNQNPIPDCIDIPPGPSPFGWTDSTKNDDENLNFFMDLPARPASYVYGVNGKVFPLNRFYALDFSSNARTYLNERGEFLPKANAAGWLVFNRADLNIYKMKINGDSLTQLSNNGVCSDPRWDASGQYIYCFQQSTSLTPSYCVKINLNGQGVSSFLADYPYTIPSSRNEHFFMLKANNNNLAVYLVNKALNTETLIVTSAFQVGGNQNDFFQLCTDQKEENLYWSNASGILHHNIPTNKTDTLFKNCESITFLNPCLSNDSEELLFCCRILKPLNSTVLYREYRSFEFNLEKKEWRELKFFPN